MMQAILKELIRHDDRFAAPRSTQYVLLCGFVLYYELFMIGNKNDSITVAGSSCQNYFTDLISCLLFVLES